VVEEMTSEKLIEMIREADPTGKRQVYLQIDSEGNGYNPVYGVWACGMDSNGDVGYEKLTDALREQGYTEEDVKKGKKILVIQP
jgi:hypothetical protein